MLYLFLKILIRCIPVLNNTVLNVVKNTCDNISGFPQTFILNLGMLLLVNYQKSQQNTWLFMSNMVPIIEPTVKRDIYLCEITLFVLDVVNNTIYACDNIPGFPQTFILNLGMLLLINYPKSGQNTWLFMSNMLPIIEPTVKRDIEQFHLSSGINNEK